MFRHPFAVSKAPRVSNNVQKKDRGDCKTEDSGNDGKRRTMDLVPWKSDSQRILAEDRDCTTPGGSASSTEGGPGSKTSRDDFI
jgi:hypothetical protein